MDALVAVDVGGTFTDVVVHDPSTGALRLAKALTTPEDPARGVLTALERAGVDLGSVRAFVHGTTLVINAITERKGARTALVTTAGFRDVLEIARTNRPDMYNFRYHKPRPFVPRRLRFEVRERLDPRGRVVAPIHLEDLEAVAVSCRAEGVEAVAICFLHAYANPEHERQAAARLRELLPQVPVSASHEVSGLWREYERTSTVVLNAYVRPAAARYLSRLGEALQACGFRGRLRLMHSAGGTASLEQACVRPILMVESGPVAGVAGAARLGRALGDGDLVTLDVGGTTAKCSLIEHGEPRMVAEYHLERTPFSAGYPLQIPAVDIVEIGAGGGSLVQRLPEGTLRVGPESAGAHPGPACYNLGGRAPTVTDAAVLVGWLDPDAFLGGAFDIRPDLARKAFEGLAADLGLSPEEAAVGALRLANTNMAGALRLVSVERGHDPRRFSLVAFGGGGPMHAAFLARELRFRRVVVPRAPGVFSAWGMLLVEPRADVMRTRVARLDRLEESEVRAAVDAMLEEVRDALGAEPVRLELTAEMRYLGQEHTVRVALDLGRPLKGVEEAFHRAHHARYRFDLRGTPVELVNLHLGALAGEAGPSLEQLPADPARVRPSPRARRRVHFGDDGWREASVYVREGLPPGLELEGPAVVEEMTSTTLVPPGWRLEVDGYGNLILTPPEGA